MKWISHRIVKNRISKKSYNLYPFHKKHKSELSRIIVFKGIPHVLAIKRQLLLGNISGYLRNHVLVAPVSVTGDRDHRRLFKYGTPKFADAMKMDKGLAGYR
jgi:hypothetical protein